MKLNMNHRTSVWTSAGVCGGELIRESAHTDSASPNTRSARFSSREVSLLAERLSDEDEGELMIGQSNACPNKGLDPNLSLAVKPHSSTPACDDSDSMQVPWCEHPNSNRRSW